MNYFPTSSRDVDLAHIYCIIAVIISVEKASIYKLGTKHDILNQLYSRSELTVCKETFISSDCFPKIDINLREALEQALVLLDKSSNIATVSVTKSKRFK